ncbi:hypothetical protein H4219_004428 [Mycoemilia scoparia]|uniref:Uncharacterized protein n=1 Tax=Mycoemilia scoparia TaxID=417184 RepID=A0A9W7ZZT8_9FUNG|nr:hypothetical protein H4219_004428 [Mycoemilia scoparia]
MSTSSNTLKNNGAKCDGSSRKHSHASDGSDRSSRSYDASFSLPPTTQNGMTISLRNDDSTDANNNSSLSAQVQTKPANLRRYSTASEARRYSSSSSNNSGPFSPSIPMTDLMGSSPSGRRMSSSSTTNANCSNQMSPRSRAHTGNGLPKSPADDESWKRHSWGCDLARGATFIDMATISEETVCPEVDGGTARNSNGSEYGKRVRGSDSGVWINPISHSESKDSNYKPFAKDLGIVFRNNGSGSSRSSGDAYRSSWQENRDSFSEDDYPNRWFQLHNRHKRSISGDPYNVDIYNDPALKPRWVRFCRVPVPVPPRGYPNQLPTIRWYIKQAERIPYIGPLLFQPVVVIPVLSIVYIVCATATFQLERIILIRDDLDWGLFMSMLQYVVAWLYIEMFAHKHGVIHRANSKLPSYRYLLPLAGLFFLNQCMVLVGWYLPNANGPIYISKTLAILVLFYFTRTFTLSSQQKAIMSNKNVTFFIWASWGGAVLGLWGATFTINPSALPWGGANLLTSIRDWGFGFVATLVLCAYLYTMQLTIYNAKCSGMAVMRVYLPMCVLCMAFLVLTTQEPLKLWHDLDLDEILPLIAPSVLGGLMLLTSIRLIDDIGPIGFIIVSHWKVFLNLIVGWKFHSFPFWAHNTIGLIIFSVSAIALAMLYIWNQRRMSPRSAIDFI